MKKKLLLSLALTSGIFTSVYAENTIRVFNSYYDEVNQTEALLSGWFQSVSDNGKYAVGFDIAMQNITYIWNAETDQITVYTSKNHSYFHDVADDGTCVGSFPVEGRGGENVHRPGYFKDGQWHALPEHYSVAGNSSDTNKAIAISPDGKFIGGIQFCEHADGGKAKAYPCVWELIDGEYVLHMYNDIDLPDHQGFFPNRMSDDGRYLVGKMYSTSGSVLLAYIKDGELHHFYDLETRMEIWEGDGQLYPESYINGVYDDGYLSDADFRDIDSDGNMIGFYTYIKENEPSYSTAVIFNENENNGELQEIDYQMGTVISGKNNFFVATGSNGYLSPSWVENGTAYSLGDAFLIDGNCSFINDMSSDGKVLVGAGIEGFEGGAYNVPVLIQLDNAIVSAEAIESDDVKININGNTVEVTGANDVKIFAINGSLVSNDANTTLDKGVYIIKADNKANKVLIK